MTPPAPTLGAEIVAALLCMHVLLKFAAFLLPYAWRRRALDRAYRGRSTATKASDAASLVVSLLLLAGLVWRRFDAVSFVGGFWVGATLVQIYFHRFHRPLQADQAPEPPASPIKTMSYAIQARPWLAWREALALSAAALLGLAGLARAMPGLS